jgi:hypothetical protein
MLPGPPLQFIFAAFALALHATPADARYSERTRHICLHANYAERERLANQGDGDGIYCSAVWNAVFYADETKSRRERQAHRVLALEGYRRAIGLGYDFNRIAMFGMTFQELIADGERLDGGGGPSTRGNSDAEFSACMGRLGVQCAAQCAGNPTCQAACTGNNAWRCRQ